MPSRCAMFQARDSPGICTSIAGSTGKSTISPSSWNMYIQPTSTAVIQRPAP